MSAEEDALFETLRIDRVQAKLAIADPAVALARDGRVEHGKGVEELARAFNLMPPASAWATTTTAGTATGPSTTAIRTPIRTRTPTPTPTPRCPMGAALPSPTPTGSAWPR